MWSAIKSMFSGEDAESKAARLAQERDAKADPRKGFVWGVLAVSYERDPGYLNEHSTMALRDWYSVKSADQLRNYRFGTKSHAGYNHYRFSFLARAGFAAGMLTEAESWEWAFREAQSVQRAYADWHGYAHGYLNGHLEYRKSSGDSPERLAEIQTSVLTRVDDRMKHVWPSIPFDTRFA